ncbi:hypothetical protein M378DRAFT_1060144 [Amanita muscaria Koide BX008]|uniref:Uncharacterized protein n=1 Tax=Amanita muscaria (strain Koide BX008) TaxID=946122 RepID=A0A0C2VZ76_AMAMK|nr:hypothetical protein M378DRAFT_1060144 [Amanita muscaria Koide BX008]
MIGEVEDGRVGGFGSGASFTAIAVEGSTSDVDANIGSVTHLDLFFPIVTNSILALGALGAPFVATFKVFKVSVVNGLPDRVDILDQDSETLRIVDRAERRKMIVNRERDGGKIGGIDSLNASIGLNHDYFTLGTFS